MVDRDSKVEIDRVDQPVWVITPILTVDLGLTAIRTLDVQVARERKYGQLICVGVGTPDHDRVAALSEIGTISGRAFGAGTVIVVGTSDEEVGGVRLGQHDRGGICVGPIVRLVVGTAGHDHCQVVRTGKPCIWPIDGDELTLRHDPLPSGKRSGGRKTHDR